MKKLLLLSLLSLLPGLCWSSPVCVTIGDSQSAGPLKGNYGFTPELQRLLVSRGYSVFSYAMPGSGADHWNDSRVKNWVGFFRDYQSPHPKEPNQGYSLSDNFTDELPGILRLNRASNAPSYFNQVLALHKDHEVDCVVIQLGDNDLFKPRAFNDLKAMVESLKNIDHPPTFCGIVTPTFKDSPKKDQYSKITNDIKKAHTEKLKSMLIQSGLADFCPALDTLTTAVKARLQALGGITSDGLHLSDQAGRVWAQEALISHPKW